ncbi:MAG TPA: hypothetical protein VG692_07610 [Gemmatimonadales bacterium]|nr:hypothetical protein [Gemmatimonadales bacterium]
MSRAFVREDRDEVPDRYELPPREDPAYPDAAAWALLEGANRGDSLGAERATGHRWGDPALRASVEKILAHARQKGDDRLEQLAERYLNAIG